jgi:hypothetical protein
MYPHYGVKFALPDEEWDIQANTAREEYSFLSDRQPPEFDLAQIIPQSSQE